MDETGPPDDARRQAGRRQGAARQRGHEPQSGNGQSADALPATHASFFSGVGGLDLGLDRAGWRTVSFSEIDPYASAVLAQRWPGVPNLGDITVLAGLDGASWPFVTEGRWDGPAYRDATLWSGGFPCQDLSVAGKRRGLGIDHGARRERARQGGRGTSGDGRDGAESGAPGGGRREQSGVAGSNGNATDFDTRSGLAFAFLALVERHRPRAILLENVPGLLSSHGGRDMAALCGAMVELGYGVAYRVLDARYFGVPQRRRRVFIVGLRSDPDDADGYLAAERAAQILAVGTRCRRHPPTGGEAGEESAAGARDGADWALRTGHQGSNGWGVQRERAHTLGGDARTQVIIRSPPDADRMRATDGLAGRLDGGDGVADTLNSGGNNGGFRTEPGAHLVFTKSHNVSATDGEHWTTDREARAMNGFDGSRTTLTITPTDDDPFLPLGLDSHRYRCCGNGVVSHVAEWIGLRLLAELRP